jgi:hypothetical protein
MSKILRMMAWVWLMAGLLAVGSVMLAGIGSDLPVPTTLAPSLSLPWSWLIPIMGIGSKMAVVVMAVGIFINAQILFVIANVLGD